MEDVAQDHVEKYSYVEKNAIRMDWSCETLIIVITILYINCSKDLLSWVQMILLSLKKLSQSTWMSVSRPNLFVILEISERLGYVIKSRLKYWIMHKYKTNYKLHSLNYTTISKQYKFSLKILNTLKKISHPSTSHFSSTCKIKPSRLLVSVQGV